jgi:dTDP-glucose 4,6-dehydratase
MNVLRLAEDKHARVLLASTSEVYGDPLVHPQPETYWGNVNPIGPRSVYDESKRVSETLAMAFMNARGVDVRIARIFNTFGPRMRDDDGRAVPQFVTQALTGAPMTVYGEGTQTRSLCYVDDLIEGLMRLLRSDYTMPVNLGNPHEVTMLQLAETVRDLCQSESIIEMRPLPVDDPQRRCPDVGVAVRELDWRAAVSLEEGLRRTIAWWRATLAARETQSTV